MSDINLTLRSDHLCKDCPDRKRVITEDGIYDCHSHCEKFRQSKAEIEEVRQKRIKNKSLDALCYGGNKNVPRR